MNSQELIEVIQSNNLEKVFFNLDDIVNSMSNFESGSYLLDSEESCYKYITSLGLNNFEVVDWECNTDNMYCVINFKEDNVYLKLIGEYDSYGQFEHDYEKGIVEVLPKQITKTIYE